MRNFSPLAASPDSDIVAATHGLRIARRAGAIAAVAAILLFAGGCTSVKVHLGMKVYLEKIPVSSIAVTLPNGPGIAPGEKSPLVVIVTQTNGKILQTEGAGHGKVLWQDITITPTLVTANPKGILSLPHDPRVSEGKTGHVIITIPSHPDLRAELEIPVRYNYHFTSNFSGSIGFSGSNGMDGTDGSSGSMGSLDPDHPSAGGDGSNGSDGSNGGDGSPGGNAPPVQVRVTLHPGTRPLLQVSVAAENKTRLYLVDPQGGTLTVSADGGAGGTGGKGGRGGRGGSGGIGSPNGSSGRDGSDGRNGFDGANGRGGLITLIYDPTAQPYLPLIHLSSRNGPPPLYKEDPVPPLW